MPSDFIRDIVADDVAANRYQQIITRFPPEPNGYLHLGHAKAICLNAGIALENKGRCNLRMDDTNPSKEDVEFVNSITDDVKWLLAGWADHVLTFVPPHSYPKLLQTNGKEDFRIFPSQNPDENTSPFFASDYFDALYYYAEQLILKGKAFVCDLSPEEIESYRGSPEHAGKDSPWRNRSIEENLALFRRMKAGEFPDASKTLRAKIDMSSPNMWMRDPLLYRIRHTAHHHAGDKWCIYPLYDFAHCLSDYIEGITHSICTLEFVVHRPLYDWILENLELPRALPHQYEFAKLNLSYTLFSKRRLMRLVQEKVVNGWDDPRLPTLAGIRRRGIPAAAIRQFAYNIGVTKYDSLTELPVYENPIRDELNNTAQRRMAVLKPIKVILSNLPENEEFPCIAPNHPKKPEMGSRTIQLTREIFIDSEDFAEVPPPKFHRLKPGGEVRLKYALIIKLDEIIKNPDGSIKELLCTADLSTRQGGPNSNRKVKGTIHWVSATQAFDAEVRLYDRLFTVQEPGADDSYLEHLNPHSLEIVTAKLEPSLSEACPGDSFQFERLGYFVPDSKDHTQEKPVFNRTITLKDTWTGK